MTPEIIAKAGTEHAHQAALFCWAQQNESKFPVLRYLHAIPNGGPRNIVAATRLRAEGVKQGVPDICLPVTCGQYAGLYIELKRPADETKNKGQVTSEQRDFHDFLLSQKYFVKVCFGYCQAVDTIVDYLRKCGF